MSWHPPGPAILFAPADRPERFATALGRADMVILDLEDGCRPENRPAGRAAIAAADLDPERVIVRVNAAGAPEQAEDLAAAEAAGVRLVMLPKAESAAQVAELAVRGFEVVALVETPLGVLRVEEIAAADGLAALFWGAEDLVAGLGGTSSRHADGTYRDVARHARARVRLAAAAHGAAALDAVHLDIADAAGLAAEAEDAAELGYAATCCIHPAQVPVIREAYRPAPADADRARRLLAEAGRNAGAFSFEGRMVDAPLFRQAEAIARRAAAADAANATPTDHPTH